MKKKVLIVIPGKSVGGNVFLRFIAGLVRPILRLLGLMSKPWMTPGSALALAGFTRDATEKLGWDVKCRIWNEQVHGPVSSWIIERYDLCLITYLTPSRLRAFDIAALAKAAGKKAIAGGIDVTGMCKENKQAELLEHFDGVFDGFLTVKSWSKVLQDWQNDTLGPINKAGADEAYEFVRPAWELIRPRDYVFVAVYSSVGCPHDCTFCGVHLVPGRRVILKPPELLAWELGYLKGKGVKVIVDSADNFGGNAVHYRKHVLPWLKASGMMWMTEISAALLVGKDGNSGLLDEMFRAGCVGVYIGVESLNLSQKKNNPESIKRAIERCNELGMLALASVILDLEEDATPESIKEAIATLLSWGFHFIQVSLKIPVPGTELSVIAAEEELLLPNINPAMFDGAFALFVHQIPPEEREQLLRDCLDLAYNKERRKELMSWVWTNQRPMIGTLIRATQRILASDRAWSKSKKRDKTT